MSQDGHDQPAPTHPGQGACVTRDAQVRDSQIRDSRGRFAPGNPGRPFGTRNRVSARVARAILADFEANQDETLLRLRRWFLPQYAAMISRLLPRNGDGEGAALDVPVSLADLRALIDQVEASGGDGADLEAMLGGADGSGS